MRKLVIVAVFLAGCGQEDPYQIENTVAQKVEKPATKWKVEGQGYFKAGLDGNPREILILTDPQGRKYLVITGCGVTEIKKTSDDKGTTYREE